MSGLLLDTSALARLDQGAPLVVAISGGKDSDALLLALAAARADHGWHGRLIALHCDVGRMEWGFSLPHCQRRAAEVGAEFVVVRHPRHDLLDGIEERMHTRPDAPPFPSAAARYCTAGWKRNTTDVWVRHEFPTGDVIVATGIRADESPRRAQAPVWALRESASSRQRRVYNWLPIHRWTLDEVWDCLLPGGRQALATWQWRYQMEQAGGRLPGIPSTARFPAHPAYLRGNSRVSCTMCVLANEGDLRNGIAHDPALFRALVDIELESGFSFQAGRWLGSLAPELLTDAQQQALNVLLTEKGRENVVLSRD